MPVSDSAVAKVLLYYCTAAALQHSGDQEKKMLTPYISLPALRGKTELDQISPGPDSGTATDLCVGSVVIRVLPACLGLSLRIR